ncbi:hypothetical protein LPJ66_002515 [Kickxella alabastrina]|uniref:Uncharacterized protein n=1 Tax=Kickxella alabastrina TaxID=61397 RepID=A0ACC1IQA6_9FUNG|nr:hypothetical protein LPJ66_002515 [Kickxella alabastrina]
MGDNRPSETTALLLPADDRSTSAALDRSTNASLERQRRRDELTGYILMASSALGFAANSACVKALSLSQIPSLEIVFARSIVQLALGLLGCVFLRASPLGPATSPRHLLVLRGAAGAFGNACFFYAVSVMTLGDATVVFFTGPVFSAVFAYWMLGEPYGKFDRVASAVCILGIVLVLKPAVLFGGSESPKGGPELWGAVAALVGAMSGALAYCVVRKVGRAVNAMVHVVYFGFISMIGSSVAMFLLQEPRMPRGQYEWVVMGLVGVFAFVGQAMLNRGLQLAPAGPGTLMRNLDVVFAVVLGITLFDEVPDWIGLVGALVIVGCTVAMGVHKWLRPQD